VQQSTDSQWDPDCGNGMHTNATPITGNDPSASNHVYVNRGPYRSHSHPISKRASIVIATHMEALDHATISRAELRAAAVAAGIPATRLLIPADGEVLSFD